METTRLLENVTFVLTGSRLTAILSLAKKWMLEASIGIKNSWKYEKDLIQLLNTFRIKKYIIQLGYFWGKFTTNLRSFFVA